MFAEFDHGMGAASLQLPSPQLSLQICTVKAFSMLPHLFNLSEKLVAQNECAQRSTSPVTPVTRGVILASSFLFGLLHVPSISGTIAVDVANDAIRLTFLRPSEIVW